LARVISSSRVWSRFACGEREYFVRWQAKQEETHLLLFGLGLGEGLDEILDLLRFDDQVVYKLFFVCWKLKHVSV
jgi:hypothetical protein